MTGEKITEQNEDMRVLITYKGSAEIGKEFQDDYMILNWSLMEDRMRWLRQL